MTYNLLKSSGIFLISLLFLFLIRTDLLLGVQQLERFQVISPLNETRDSGTPVMGTLNIIGVMVEFQPDSNRFTSGNGTFETGSIPYLEDPGTTIDALPHDEGYFRAHLEFVKNYFEHQSNGRLNINYDLLPTIYRLDKEMAEYSPIGENPDLSTLGNLVQDVWELVSRDGSLSLSSMNHNNTAFVIFHAGIGRDIELTGTSLDKTPQDIPSVYLGNNALRNILNDPSFSGFEIDAGNILVTNTLIVPRTLSRAGEDVTGQKFVLPLSINGLLTAQIASHLGLPDLFNTNTGESGIGRFGLMDGAGIFSFNGLFPPGLSAWEKIHLGWAQPFHLPYNFENTVTLPAASLNEENSIARIPISNSEYFLVENRHRDPDENGVELTIRRPDGSLTTQQFTNRDERFINRDPGFDELLEPGVIINVSNFDFALPGGFDAGDQSSAERELNGGILIWHIDESVISQNLGRTGVNSNPDRRGVNLKEADGAQDIGRATAIGLSQNESNGSAFDFWWSGNNATVITQTDSLVLYQNRFGPDTTPNTNSNSGAPSYFELYDFSDNLPQASFRIRSVNPFDNLYTVFDERSDITITAYTENTDSYYSRFPLAIQPLSDSENKFILLPGSDGILLYDLDIRSFIEIDHQFHSIQQPFIDSNSQIFTVTQYPQPQAENLKTEVYSSADNQIARIGSFKTPPNSGFVSSHENMILDFDGTAIRADLQNFEVFETGISSQISEYVRGYQSKIADNQLVISSPNSNYIIQLPPISSRFNRTHTGIIDISARELLVYVLLDGSLLIYSDKDNFKEFVEIADHTFMHWPAIADFNQDGYPDFLFTTSDGILSGKNRLGATLTNFPIKPPEGFQFTGTPLIADLNGNGLYEVLVAGQDSYSINLYAFDPDGNLVNGFPLYVGGVSTQNNLPVNPLIFDNKIIALSHQGDLKIWDFHGIGNILWRSGYGNFTNNKVTARIQSEAAPEPVYSLLNADETYNWPNPAGDETHIRFQTRYPADISLKITTMSGRLIYNHQFRSRGSVPEEILIDTSSWSSGGYFAMLEATYGSEKERKLIKIAIAK